MRSAQTFGLPKYTMFVASRHRPILKPTIRHRRLGAKAPSRRLLLARKNAGVRKAVAPAICLIKYQGYLPIF